MSVPSASRAVAVRASDREREQHIDLLRRHAGDGRLTVDELEQRIECACAARTHEELGAVLAELPALADSGAQPGVAVNRRALTVADLAPYVGVNLLLIRGLGAQRRRLLLADLVDPGLGCVRRLRCGAAPTRAAAAPRRMP